METRHPPHSLDLDLDLSNKAKRGDVPLLGGGVVTPLCISSAWVSLRRAMLCWRGDGHRFCGDGCLVPVSAVSRPQQRGDESLPGFLSMLRVV